MAIFRQSRYRSSSVVLVVVKIKTKIHRTRRRRISIIVTGTPILANPPPPTSGTGTTTVDDTTDSTPPANTPALTSQAAAVPSVETVEVKPAVYRNDISPGTFSYTEHQIVQGDRIDILASHFYGDPQKWWRIADANPDLIFYPDELPVGEILKIPDAATLRFL